MNQKLLNKRVAILAADADFARNPIAGAKENAGVHGFRIVSERTYLRVLAPGATDDVPGR